VPSRKGKLAQGRRVHRFADLPNFGDITAVPSYFSCLSLDQHFARLGDGRRSKGFADTVLVMVANRLIDPRSKRGTVIDWMGRDVALRL
jgi:hypothetical protein